MEPVKKQVTQPQQAPQKPVEQKIVIEMSRDEALDIFEAIEGSQIMEEYLKVNDLIAKGDRLAQFSSILRSKLEPKKQ